MRNTFLYILAVIFVAGGLVAVNMYTKEHDDLNSQKPDHSLSANQLFENFANNEADANKIYLDKIVELNGFLSKIEKDEEGNVQLYLKSDDPMFGVICNMADGFEARDMQQGDPIVIRGICSGYLMDVALNRCVLIE